MDEEIISIPPFIAELPTNVPWIVRPGGPNVREQIQYRDPTPDHLHAGLMDATPRVRELICIFGILRAARINADVWLQTNRMSVDDAVEYWMKYTPYLDTAVARVDAEIYLRRPPWYGLGFTMGMLQMQQLLGDRKRQLGDALVLKEFHDALMATGRLPMSLIRWEMTGSDDEVRRFRVREAMPAVRGD